MKKLKEQRQHNVIKSNVLIQKSRHDLSLAEQKILLSLVQMIEPEDIEFKEYKFSIKDFCNLCGIDDRSGKNYEDIKKIVKTLSDKSYWIKEGEEVEKLIRWINQPSINPGTGTIKVKLDDMMKPYLLQLKEYFTQYSLYYTLAMKSKYSLRLYELLKSYQNLKKKPFDIEKIKIMLMAQNYEKWTDFKINVIDKAVNEINFLTDISVTYELTKTGRQFTEITFFIKLKKGIDERMETWQHIENRLNPKEIENQISMLLNEEIENE